MAGEGEGFYECIITCVHTGDNVSHDYLRVCFETWFLENGVIPDIIFSNDAVLEVGGIIAFTTEFDSILDGDLVNVDLTANETLSDSDSD
ncbi:Oncoid [Papillomaviridae sp. Haddock_c145]|nr:Oncoid [Papillomaviridae sp. Haddock_c145]